MAMCPKDVTDICMSRRDNENRLMGPPIIELEFEKAILDPQKKQYAERKKVREQSERGEHEKRLLPNQK